jgi:hypothetical protein
MVWYTRTAKGSQLTIVEGDTNVTNARDGIDMQLPKTSGVGIKTDSLGTPSFPWHDLTGTLSVEHDDANHPELVIFRDNIRAYEFLSTTTSAYTNLHIPHDYVPGSDLFIHVHWLHNSAIVTGGTCTWGFEVTYAKGHQQGAFGASKLVTVAQNAELTQYSHQIAETALSISGGSATQLDSDDIETDGVICTRVYLDSNDITSSGAVPDPFIFFVDVHYQSTGIGTKQKSPDFWT